MKLNKGIGIITLIFFLCLHILGASEAKPTSTDVALSEQTLPTPEQQDVLSGDHSGLLFEDALHRQSVSASDWQQGLRKFTAALKLLLSLQSAEQVPGHLFAAALHFSLHKDLPVSYHNLRI